MFSLNYEEMEEEGKREAQTDGHKRIDRKKIGRDKKTQRTDTERGTLMKAKRQTQIDTNRQTKTQRQTRRKDRLTNRQR